MAPQQDDLQKDEWDPPPWASQGDFDATIVTTASSSSPLVTVSMAFSTQSPTDDDSSQTRHRPTTRPDGYPSTLPWPPYPLIVPTTTANSWETSISSTTAVTEIPYPEAETTAPLSGTATFPGTRTGAPSPSLVGPFGGRPSGWDWPKNHASKAPLYAVAAAVPILVLAIIGVVTLLCLRRRKKRRAEAAAQSVQEAKMASQAPIVRAHMAPPPAPVPVLSVSQPYDAPPNHLPPTSVSSQVQPIILGPIGSSSTGAYLTGMDTSDMVSITSNPHMGVDPFSDSHSITGPPPPYRPSSVPPPSFTTNSRQSSLRVPVSPVCARGMERSPFDDPDDAMSTVSDMSFQRDLYIRAYSPR